MAVIDWTIAVLALGSFAWAVQQYVSGRREHRRERERAETEELIRRSREHWRERIKQGQQPGPIESRINLNRSTP
jgi:hypothetical protein